MPFVHFGPVSRRVQSPKFQSLEFRPLQSMETESRMQPPTIATIMIRRPMWPSPSSRFDRPPFSPTMALLHALATLSSTRRPNYRQLEQPIRPPNPRVILFVHNTNALNNENSNVENSSENQDQTENDTTMNGVDSVEEPMIFQPNPLQSTFIRFGSEQDQPSVIYPQSESAMNVVDSNEKTDDQLMVKHFEAPTVSQQQNSRQIVEIPVPLYFPVRVSEPVRPPMPALMAQSEPESLEPMPVPKQFAAAHSFIAPEFRFLRQSSEPLVTFHKDQINPRMEENYRPANRIESLPPSLIGNVEKPIDYQGIEPVQRALSFLPAHITPEIRRPAVIYRYRASIPVQSPLEVKPLLRDLSENSNEIVPGSMKEPNEQQPHVIANFPAYNERLQQWQDYQHQQPQQQQAKENQPNLVPNMEDGNDGNRNSNRSPMTHFMMIDNNRAQSNEASSIGEEDVPSSKESTSFIPEQSFRQHFIPVANLEHKPDLSQQQSQQFDSLPKPSPSESGQHLIYLTNIDQAQQQQHQQQSFQMPSTQPPALMERSIPEEFNKQRSGLTGGQAALFILTQPNKGMIASNEETSAVNTSDDEMNSRGF
ncbi:hypothetical protein QR98_0096030 [Sarcoptes scabiei]|uniref:Uncharacterized protein n=1 Tax=Sarcoptes scabiei TaxID=52283 RepID=A0A132AJE0_SARSC|nr:hypothetical protein QR98_0096030 [Sarcoptes scabiei]